MGEHASETSEAAINISCSITFTLTTELADPALGSEHPVSGQPRTQGLFNDEIFTFWDAAIMLNIRVIPFTIYRL